MSPDTQDLDLALAELEADGEAMRNAITAIQQLTADLAEARRQVEGWKQNAMTIGVNEARLQLALDAAEVRVRALEQRDKEAATEIREIASLLHGGGDVALRRVADRLDPPR